MSCLVKTVRTLKLWFREGSSDKVYIVDLIDTENVGREARFLVNFRYGRRGHTLREGTKTPAAVSQGEAEKIFDSIVISKVNAGYSRADSAEAHMPSPEFAGIDSTVVDGREKTLLSYLEACLRDPWPLEKRDRLFWRVGEIRMRSAAPLLEQFIQQNGAGQASYSLAWAMARCGGEEAVAPLVAIAGETQDALVRGLTNFALISPLMEELRRTAQPQLRLAPGIAAALAKCDIDALHGAMSEFAKSDPVRTGEVMVELYRLAQEDPALHALLAKLILRLPVRPPFIPGLRRMFKYAEMIDDAAIFGAVAHRFETTKPMYRTSYMQRERKTPHAFVAELHQYRWQPLDHLKGARDAKTALSENTLHYMKRRIWRTLRKRGETGQQSFLDLATGYLLAFSENDLAEPVTQHFWHWNRDTRQSYTVTRQYGPLAQAWSAGQLLYRNAPDVTLRARSLSYFWDDAAKMDYGSAFPEMWAAHPAYALSLAGESRCEPIAMFGLSILKTQPEFLRKQSVYILEQLLGSAFAPIATFAFDEAKSRLAEGHDDDDALIAALMSANLSDARDLAIKRIDLKVNWPWGSPQLGFLAATSPHKEIQETALRWCAERALPEAAAQTLATDIADWLTDLSSPQFDESHIACLHHLRECLPHLWPRHDLPLEAERVGTLMACEITEIAAIGIALFSVSPADPGTLPDSTWNQILNSPAPEIQSAALGLLCRVSDEDLSERAPLIASLATAPSTDVRRAARPLISRLAARYPRLGDDLAARLIHSLFRSAPDDSYADDTVALLREGLPDQVAAMDANLVWRLLHAKAKGAQLLGWVALEPRDPASFSVRQLARLGNHPFTDVRRWVMTVYETSPTRFQEDAADAVLLIESTWPDACEFAMETFERWPEQVWSPEVLAVIADSTNPKVLDFARTILRRTLRPGDASAQLLRLLEHPAASMHLLVTEILTENAAGNEAIFEKLLPLSRIILLQMHKGRIAKDRIGSFLHAEALKSKQRAQAIAPIFTDLSLSVTDRDRIMAVMALRDIENTYPGFAGTLPLKRIEPAVRTV